MRQTNSIQHFDIHAYTWFLTTFFSLFSCESDDLTFTFVHSTIYIIHQTFFFVKFYDCFFYSSVIVYNLISLLSASPTTPWNTICWIALGSASKSFRLFKSTAISL